MSDQYFNQYINIEPKTIGTAVNSPVGLTSVIMTNLVCETRKIFKCFRPNQIPALPQAIPYIRIRISQRELDFNTGLRLIRAAEQPGTDNRHCNAAIIGECSDNIIERIDCKIYVLLELMTSVLDKNSL